MKSKQTTLSINPRISFKLTTALNFTWAIKDSSSDLHNIFNIVFFRIDNYMRREEKFWSWIINKPTYFHYNGKALSCKVIFTSHYHIFKELHVTKFCLLIMIYIPLLLIWPLFSQWKRSIESLFEDRFVCVEHTIFSIYEPRLRIPRGLFTRTIDKNPTLFQYPQYK